MVPVEGLFSTDGNHPRTPITGHTRNGISSVGFGTEFPAIPASYFSVRTFLLLSRFRIWVFFRSFSHPPKALSPADNKVVRGCEFVLFNFVKDEEYFLIFNLNYHTNGYFPVLTVKSALFLSSLKPSYINLSESPL
jgi:hypothetical protein